MEIPPAPRRRRPCVVDCIFHDLHGGTAVTTSIGRLALLDLDLGGAIRGTWKCDHPGLGRLW
eukprot:4601761-Pyramimonas_sp.AAC.1